MKRAALYARFSSDRQNERSCRDQLDLCRAWAEKQGIIVVAEYDDAAVSGASTVNRLGLGRMMRDAREGLFDVVICEALDRLSRDQADLATIKKQLKFLEIGIATVQDGEVGAMHIGLKGLMGEMYLADLAQKTRRGQSARVRAGASGGGRSYGYDPAPGKPGELTVNETEAAVVRRIFAEYARGKTPREIVAGLNREGIPGPRGGPWNASTINGSRDRANGILRNRLYVGEIVWNRQRFVKDPDTGKRVSRKNPESEWLTAPAPHLAIVDRKVWDKAAARQSAHAAYPPSKARKPVHLLSGLVKCACCGGGFTIINRDRMGCSAVRERGTCDNRTMIARSEIERRVVESLRRHLCDPAMTAEFVRAYHERRRQLVDENRSSRGERERRLAELTRAIDRGIAAILDGTAPDGLGPRVQQMEREAADLRAAIADDGPAPIQIHPAAADRYAQMAADLQAHLSGSRSDRISGKIREMIDRIEIGRKTGEEPAPITVHGFLAELIPARRGKVVAGARNSHSPTVTMVA